MSTATRKEIRSFDNHVVDDITSMSVLGDDVLSHREIVTSYYYGRDSSSMYDICQRVWTLSTCLIGSCFFIFILLLSSSFRET